MLAKKILETVPLSICVLRVLSREELGGSLSLNQLRVLNLVQNGHGQTSIADFLEISLAAVSKMIDSLEGKDLVARRAGKDKRTYVLRVTAKGKKLMEKVSSQIEGHLNQGLNSFSTEQKRELMQGLFLLDQLMQKLKKE